MSAGEGRLRVLLHLRAQGERELVTAYDGIRREVAEADGHVSDQLLQSLDDPGQWLITSEWETPEHYARWARGHRVDELAAPIVEVSEDRRHMRYAVRRHTVRGEEGTGREGPA
ncbi:antibiotic biosynthesis monooxygenase family protein [Streptosporangium sp. NPDC023615]|uniref:antibiotic biosynthesis monooxygenase family protein n=1 Tax=Streptosporangium sp. NPDC023615 TaxID=3154794 RepID=UPI0034142785